MEAPALMPMMAIVELTANPAIGLGLRTTRTGRRPSMLNVAVLPTRSRKSSLVGTAMALTTVSAVPTAVNASGVGLPMT